MKLPAAETKYSPDIRKGQSSDLPDPTTYPAGSSRIVRMKQEGHVSHQGGTFSPMVQIRQNS